MGRGKGGKRKRGEEGGKGGGKGTTPVANANACAYLPGPGVELLNLVPGR